LAHPTSVRIRHLDREVRTEFALRGLAVAAYCLLTASVLNQWLLAPYRLTLLALLLIELFTLGLVVCAREAKFRDLSPMALASTLLASFYFVFLNFEPGRHVVPELVALSIQGLGMIWQVWSKYTLGRSFGLLPAHRGIITSGPFRFVRHPIYLGYFIAHIGFLGANFSWHNILVFAGLYGLQILRMRREEKLLAAVSVQYRAYRTRVRWRFLPWIY
jgi:protein-S-isoprenylcysteine O-methyltransferase Ste14